MKVSIVALLTLVLASPALAAESLAVSVANEALPVAPGDTLLTVTADGKSTRVPDIANFSAGVTTIGKTASAAMAANAAAMTRVIDALKAAGIADRDVQTSNLSLSPVFDNSVQREGDRPRITGYQASNNVAVRARDLNRTGPIIDTLVIAGANEVNGPNFDLDNPAAALDEARTAAIVSARSRAALYARATSLKVLRILSINESSGFSPRPMMAMKARTMAASTPVAPGEMEMSLTVTLQFELAPL